MKKIRVLLIFVLWIFLGWFVSLIYVQYQRFHTPIFQEGKLDIQELLYSIKQVVSPWSSLINDSFQRFDAIYQLLQSSYYDQDKLNTWTMLDYAIKAFVDGIGDPYTVYMDSVQLSWFQEELKGQTDFEWIGAVVSKKEYYVMIEEILKWSPAFQAWLMPLDRIVMVDSWSVKDLDVNQAVAKIRWPKWTKVTLIIERIKKGGGKEMLEKTVIRDKLSVPSVTSQIFTGQKKIGYINISIIGEETENLLQDVVADLKKQSVQGIILDLRGNGWWLLPIASEVASHFLPKDVLIATAKYKIYEDEKYLSRWYNDFGDIPMVVLIDGMTASAGEIIAMALQEQGWATLLGTQTFGKWSIQTMDDLTEGASLKYTIGKWYSPKGENVDGSWITPDVLLEFDVESYMSGRIDNQLSKAKEIIYGS